jgi:hypothetical protein
VKVEVLLVGTDERVKIGCVNVVIDVAVGIGDAGILRREAPLAIHDEFVSESVERY